MKELKIIQQKYTEGINCCQRFVNDNGNKTEVLVTAIFFAKLEHLFRGPNSIVFNRLKETFRY